MGHKTKHGSYYNPHPVDFAILELLPPEGKMLGYHVIALPTGAITKTLNKEVPKEAQLTPTAVAGRIMAMNYEGLVVKQLLLGARGQFGWQRTRKGAAYYEQQTGKQLDPQEGAASLVSLPAFNETGDGYDAS